MNGLEEGWLAAELEASDAEKGLLNDGMKEELESLLENQVFAD